MGTQENSFFRPDTYKENLHREKNIEGKISLEGRTRFYFKYPIYIFFFSCNLLVPDDCFQSHMKPLVK